MPVELVCSDRALHDAKAKSFLVALDLRSKTMELRSEREALVPSDVLLHHVIRYELPNFPASPRSLLEALRPLAERVVAGYAPRVVGGVEIGVFSNDAVVADDGIRLLCDACCDELEVDSRATTAECFAYRTPAVEFLGPIDFDEERTLIGLLNPRSNSKLAEN